MLDERTDLLLTFIVDYCKDESFKLIDMCEMISVFPLKFKMDSDGILQMLSYLKEREYIVEKFSDGERFCICPLPKGRFYLENKRDKVIAEKVKKLKDKKFFWLTFLASFLGAISAVVLAVLLC